MDAVGNPIEVSRAAERAVSSVAALLRVRRAILLQLDAAAGLLTCVAVAGREGEREWIGRTLNVGEGAGGLALAVGKPVWTAEPLSDSRLVIPDWLRQRILEEDLGSVFGVPLMAPHGPIGALVLVDGHGRVFTDDDVRLATAFADQAALALDNARLYAETEHRRQQAEELARIARLLTESLDVTALAARIVETVLPLVDVHSSVLRLMQPDGSLVAIAVGGRARDQFQPGHVLPRGVGAVGRSAAEGRPVCRDVLDETDVVLTDDVRRRMTQTGLRTVLAVPLALKREVLGVLAVGSEAKRSFSEADVSLVQAFADQAALALDNARLYGIQEVRATRLRTLATLNQMISSSLDTDEVLRRIARAAADLIDAAVVECWVADDTEQLMKLHAFSNPEIGTDKRLTKLPFGQGGVGWAARHRSALMIPDVFADDRIHAPEWFRTHDLRSGLWLPIMSYGELLGVLSIFGRKPFELSPSDADLVDSFVAQAAVAIQNARLHQTLRIAHHALEKSQAHIVQTERLTALGQMAAGVAHNFNNLLAVIVGRAELLLRQAGDGPARRGIEAIHRAGVNGAQTVRRILEFTGTRRAQDFVKVDLRQLLLDVMELGRPRWSGEAQSRGIRYDVRVEAPEVPPIAGRPEELREVFLNLLFNALEAMPAGGQCVFRLTTRDEEITVEVQDTGLGMPEETRRRVFEPFFTTKGPRASGLGLAVSWGIVTRHGGTIAAESTPDSGTTMIVRLPVGRDFAVAGEQAAPPPPRTPAHILVIDDETSVREVLVDILRDAGYDVIEAGGGTEGLARCETEAVDLIVSDVSMPGMSGWEIAATCRTRFPHVQIGLITGWGDRFEAQNVAQRHIRFVLPKPFAANDVLRCVAEALTPVDKPDDQRSDQADR